MRQHLLADDAASTWLANVPAIIMPALFVVTNTVILYWLTGAIHRLWAGDRSIKMAAAGATSCVWRDGAQRSMDRRFEPINLQPAVRAS